MPPNFSLKNFLLLSLSWTESSDFAKCQWYQHRDLKVNLDCDKDLKNAWKRVKYLATSGEQTVDVSAEANRPMKCSRASIQGKLSLNLSCLFWVDPRDLPLVGFIFCFSFCGQNETKNEKWSKPDCWFTGAKLRKVKNRNYKTADDEQWKWCWQENKRTSGEQRSRRSCCQIRKFRW